MYNAWCVYLFLENLVLTIKVERKMDDELQNEKSVLICNAVV